MSNINNQEPATYTDSRLVNQPTKKYKKSREKEIKERLAALEKVMSNYNNDPAYWLDLLNSNSKKEIKSHAQKRLLELGWEVKRIGKKKSG